MALLQSTKGAKIRTLVSRKTITVITASIWYSKLLIKLSLQPPDVYQTYSESAVNFFHYNEISEFHDSQKFELPWAVEILLTLNWMHQINFNLDVEKFDSVR
jgi:hypothetical protein